MIDLYEFGRVIVDGKTYQHDIIILPDKIIGNWWRKEGHKLCIDDIEPIIAASPRTVVIGTGESGMMKVLEEVKKILQSRDIEAIITETRKACELYNEIHKSRNTAAALHLTC